MKDWPEGTRRSLTLELALTAPVRSSDALATMREADAGSKLNEMVIFGREVLPLVR
jgi:hypothetical protein